MPDPARFHATNDVLSLNIPNGEITLPKKRDKYRFVVSNITGTNNMLYPTVQFLSLEPQLVFITLFQYFINISLN